MVAIRNRLWPRDRLLIAVLLCAIWVLFLVALVNYVDYVDDNQEQNATKQLQPEEDEPNDFAETVDWTWGHALGQLCCVGADQRP